MRPLRDRGQIELRGRPHIRGSRRRIGILSLVAVLLCGTAVGAYRLITDIDIAQTAVVTASSVGPGASPADLVSSGSARSPGAGWRADRQTVGAWVQLTWAQPVRLSELTVVRTPLGQPGVSAGFLTFGDGSRIRMSLSSTERPSTLRFLPRTVTSMRFTVVSVQPGTTVAALDEVILPSRPTGPRVERDAPDDGNLAAIATATTSAGGSLGPGLETTPRVGAEDGRGWSTPDSAGGAWVQYQWKAAQEVASVQIAGSGTGPQLSRARLTFSDGSSLPVAAVSHRADLPTVVGFMPRVVSWVRLSVDAVNGPGALTLSSWSVYQAGSSPVRSDPAGRAPAPTPAPACPGRPTSEGLAILCPALGETVGDRQRIEVAAPAGTRQVSAAVWPSTAAGTTTKATAAVTTGVVDGRAVLNLDLGSLPSGPFTVHVQGAGPSAASSVDLTLVHSPRSPSETPGPPEPAESGRTLIWDDEFDRPISVSASGTDTVYAAGKPNRTGIESFGDSAFAPPSEAPDLIGTSEGDLRLLARRTSSADRGSPWISGAISSARPGGSGISAEYGYFEARMLTSAAPGTWPAFWMLPSDALAEDPPVVAEIDAVELYGHDPRSTCHSTHSYRAGEDRGRTQCLRSFDSVRQALQWHTYGVSVDPTEIVFTVDGRVVARSAQVPGGEKPLFFMIDLALGGGWPLDLTAAGDRAALYVDWVHVYV